MNLSIGQKVTVRGSIMTVRAILPAGTVEVQSDVTGAWFRVSGLSFSGSQCSTDPRAAKPVRVRCECNECGKKFSVSPNASDPDCPKCGGVDFEVL